MVTLIVVSGVGGVGGEAWRGKEKELLRLIGAQNASIVPGKEVRSFVLDSILRRVAVTCLGLLSCCSPS